VSGGYYKIRAWPRGPWVPCRLEEHIPLDPLTGEVLDRSTLQGNPATRETGYIDDTEAGALEVQDYGRPIGREEYEWLRAQFEILKRHPWLGRRWRKSYRNPLSRR